MLRTAVLSVLALGLMAAPALAFETSTVAAPKSEAPHFTNEGKVFGMMPAVASEQFRFGQADQAQAKGATVVYELKAGKTADRVDVADPRDNPFMPQPERSSRPAH